MRVLPAEDLCGCVVVRVRPQELPQPRTSPRMDHGITCSCGWLRSCRDETPPIVRSLPPVWNGRICPAITIENLGLHPAAAVIGDAAAIPSAVLRHGWSSSPHLSWALLQPVSVPHPAHFQLRHASRLLRSDLTSAGRCCHHFRSAVPSC